jgi:hypothetical protein
VQIGNGGRCGFLCQRDSRGFRTLTPVARWDLDSYILGRRKLRFVTLVVSYGEESFHPNSFLFSSGVDSAQCQSLPKFASAGQMFFPNRQFLTPATSGKDLFPASDRIVGYSVNAVCPI